jgi:hypothetical protein
MYRVNPDNTEARAALSSMITDPNVTETSQAVVKRIYDEFEADYENMQINGQNYQVSLCQYKTVCSYVYLGTWRLVYVNAWPELSGSYV